MSHERLKAGNHIEQLLVDAALTQTTEVSMKV
jgi:hypothetical protein